MWRLIADVIVLLERCQCRDPGGSPPAVHDEEEVKGFVPVLVYGRWTCDSRCSVKWGLFITFPVDGFHFTWQEGSEAVEKTMVGGGGEAYDTWRLKEQWIKRGQGDSRERRGETATGEMERALSEEVREERAERMEEEKDEPE